MPVVGTTGDDSIIGSTDGPGAKMDYIIGLEGNDTLAAGGSSQTLDGLAGNDVLIGSTGTKAFGGDGDDLLQGVYDGHGDAGNDTLIGGLDPAGNNDAFLHGGMGDDSVVGTSGNDFLSGGGGSNIVHGGDGSDVFVIFDMAFHTGFVGYSNAVGGNGHPGDNIIDGGAGSDSLDLSSFFSNNIPTTGNMVVDFANGIATTSAFTFNYGSSREIPAGRVSFANIESAYTGSGDDSLSGSTNGERLFSGLGSDTIHGGAGDDIIFGDATSRTFGTISDGSNVLRGEAGNDAIVGGDVSDWLDGGTGADTLDGRAGDDVLIGGDGDDRLIAGPGVDTLAGGAGSDLFFFSGNLDAREAFANVVTDWSTDDRLDFLTTSGRGYAERTAATYQAAYDDAQAVVRSAPVSYVATQVGSDVIIFANSVAADVNTGTGWVETADKNLDVAVILKGRTLGAISADHIQGAVVVDVGAVPPPTPAPPAGPGAFAFGSISPAAALNINATDKVSFSGETPAMAHYNSDGTITVVMGATSVTFGANISAVSKAGGLSMADGSKLFIGDAGNEHFVGTGNADEAFGGQGDDSLDGWYGDDLLQGNQGRDRLLGGEGDDVIYGGKDEDVLMTGDGKNFAQGNLGQDQLHGGNGADTLLGGKENDTIYGGSGGDFLNGNLSDDSISAGAGNDTLYGEGGSDTLVGGSGADVFHAFASQGLDRVLDFSRAEGDRIMLRPGMGYSVSQSGADTVISLGGADQFVLVGVSAASLTGDWIGT